MKAIAPKTLPNLPERATGWARSTRRADSMFHAHLLGYQMCNPHRYLNRFTSEQTNELHKLQYHGVCPRCFKLGGNIPS